MNCKAMIAYRTLNQWCRRHIVRILPRLFKSLQDERIMLAAAKLRTSYTYKRLRQINWIIGQGSVIYLTAREYDRLDKIVTQIFQEKKQCQL